MLPEAAVQLLSSKIVHFDVKSMKLCQLTTIPKTFFLIWSQPKFAFGAEYCACHKNRQHGNEAENKTL